MQLSVSRFDVALYTNNLSPMLAFWQGELGAEFDREVSMGAAGGVQHRHTLRNCIFKINHYEEPLEDSPPSGYREILVATEGVEAPKAISDPDGNRVTLVPPGWQGISELAVRVESNDIAAHDTWYGDVLGLERDGNTYRLGGCCVILERAENPVMASSMKGKGFRYLTLGVADIHAAHAQALAAGVEEGAAVREVGIVRFSQLRDPDGNWLELSQR